MAFKMRSKLWKSGPMKPTSKLSVDIPDAASRATRFITELTNGIFVHAEGKGPNDTQSPTGWSMLDALEYIMEGVTRFWVGVKQGASNVTMRFGVDTESHMEMDYHSMQLIDKEGNTYFHVSDLRDSSGVAKVSQFVGVESVGSAYTDGELNECIDVQVEEVAYTPVYDDSSHVKDGTAQVNGYSSVKHIASMQSNPKVFLITFYTHHDGTQLNVAVGDSVAVGYSTEEAVKAFTFGTRHQGSLVGANSFSAGSNNTASGVASVAEGEYTEASGYASHTEGNITSASGDFSHAEGGSFTTASGKWSHAEGIGTEARGDGSHSGGHNTVAVGECQTVIGRYNALDTTENSKWGRYAFIIGNGNFNTKSNAFAVDWSGNVRTAGGVQDMSGNARYTKTRVKGNAETTYRTGDVNLTPANIGAAASSHTHSQSSMVITRSFTNSAASGSIAAGANWSAVFRGTNVSGYTKVGLVSLTGAGGNFAIRTIDIDQDSAEIHLFNKGSSAASCAKGAATATFAYVRSSVSVS